MGKRDTVVRIDRSLRGQVDAFARRLEREHGVVITRAAAATALLNLALRALNRKERKR